MFFHRGLEGVQGDGTNDGNGHRLPMRKRSSKDKDYSRSSACPAPDFLLERVTTRPSAIR
jgi:hypothetical protein